MADSRSALIKRIFSALCAGILIFCIGYFGGKTGLIAVSLLAISLSIREYSRMLFSHVPQARPLKWFFIFVCFCLVAALGLLEWPTATALALSCMALIVGGIWLTRNSLSNEQLLTLLATATLGLIYTVYFPMFAVDLAKLPNGPLWFLFLLLVVFFGDTFAYFGGRFLGKNKLMPQISPNKTIEGALAGVFGSCLAGSILVWQSFPSISILQTIVFCAICGFAAQAGDLFVSLVKRVANVKDSGSIMPGHGGILDRLDGVFIACPLVYAFALYTQG